MMEVLSIKLLVCILLCTISSEVSCLYCYTCNTDDRFTCNRTQEIKPCSHDSICATISYGYQSLSNNQLNVMSVFRKFCSPAELPCDWMCRSAEEAGNKNCKIACCQENLCNQEIDESEIFFGLTSYNAATILKPVQIILFSLSLSIIATLL